MLEINLLPEELRKKRSRERLYNLKLYIPVVIISSMFLILVYLVMVIGVIGKVNEQRKQEKIWKELFPKKKESDSLNKEMSGLSFKVEIIEGLIENKFLWSEKLKSLSGNVPDNIWLRNFSLEKKEELNYLKIDGTVVSLEAEETASVGRFMARLEKDESFFKGFERMELKSIQRRRIRNIEVMDFTIVCYE